MSGKILITGASGFVGFHLVEQATAAGFVVHAAVRKSSKVDDIKPFVNKFVYPDFDNSDSLNELFRDEQYDYVIHAAAMTKAKVEAEMFHVNVGYTERLIQAAFASATPPKRFVFVSSLAAIGPRAYNDADIQDNAPNKPVTVYGRSKQAAEELVKKQFSNLPITIIRPTAVYGPREKDLFILFDTLNKGVDAYIGRKPQKLSFVYVVDLVHVLLQACTAPQQQLTIFNITDGHVYDRYAMAEIFKQTTGKKPLRLHLPLALVKKVAQLSAWCYKNSDKTPVLYPERLNELTAENWSCDIHRAVEILDYKPQYNLQRGLSNTLNWYKDNKWF